MRYSHDSPHLVTKLSPQSATRYWLNGLRAFPQYWCTISVSPSSPYRLRAPHDFLTYLTNKLIPIQLLVYRVLVELVSLDRPELVPFASSPPAVRPRIPPHRFTERDIKSPALTQRETKTQGLHCHLPHPSHSTPQRPPHAQEDF